MENRQIEAHFELRSQFCVFLKYLSFCVLVAGACARRPEKTVAWGEDPNLIAKSSLSQSFAYKELAESGDPKIAKLASFIEAGKTQSALFLNKDPQSWSNKQLRVRFAINTYYIFVEVASDAEQSFAPLYAFAINHFDLQPQRNSKGEETRYITKDTLVQPNPLARAYIEIKEFDNPIYLKPDNNTDKLYFNRIQLENLSFDLMSDPIPGLQEPKRQEIISHFNLTRTPHLEVTFKLLENYILLIAKEDGKVLHEMTDHEYVDLVQKTVSVNGVDELTPQLIENTSKFWGDRHYVVIRKASFNLVTEDKNLFKNLYNKSEIPESFVWSGDPTQVPILKDGDIAIIKTGFENGPIPIKNGETIYISYSEDFINFSVLEKVQEELASGENHAPVDMRHILCQFAVTHYDLVNALDPVTGANLAHLEKNNTKNTWEKRIYIELNPSKPEFAYLEKSLSDSFGMIRKKDLAQEYSSIDELPESPDIRFDLKGDITAALKKRNEVLSDNQKICIDMGSVSLRIYILPKEEKCSMARYYKLLVLYPITLQFDLRHRQTSDKRQDLAAIEADVTTHPNLSDREYIMVDATNPQFLEDQVQLRALPRSVFSEKAEYIYSAMITEIKSENGVFFPGESVTTDSRIKFKMTDQNLIAYKSDDPLNSGKPTEILKYPAHYFNIEYNRDRYDEPGNKIIEGGMDKPWEERTHMRVSLENNLIPGYFNDLFGIHKFYYGDVILSNSEISQDITVDGDLIYYETTETFTPSIRQNLRNPSLGESGFSPSTVVVRHSFLRVDNRPSDYQPKPYNWAYMSMYGFFWDTRLELDSFGRATDAKEFMMANRHNIAGGKKIVFYLNNDWPNAKIPIAQTVIGEWNKVFKKAFPERNDDIVVLNSTDRKNFADPRVNVLVWLTGKYSPSPAGYGPSLTDPKTGEIISAKAFYYPDVSLMIAERIGRYLELVENGCLSDDASAVRLPPIKGLLESSGPCGAKSLIDPSLLVDEKEKIISPVTLSNGEDSVSVSFPGYESLKYLIEVTSGPAYLSETDRVLPSSTFNGKMQDHSLVKNLVKNYDLLSRMNLQEIDRSPFYAMEGLSDLSTKAIVAPQDYDQDVLFQMNTELAHAIKERTQMLIGQDSKSHKLGECALDMDYLINPIISYVLANKGKDRYTLIKEAVALFEIEVFLHEVGHNMGLSHNFAGSFDRNNYPDEYFKLEGDPEAEEKHIKGYMSSSVMDYNQTMEGSFNTLGKYDYAAILFGYRGELQSKSAGKPNITLEQVEDEVAKRGASLEKGDFESYDRTLKSVAYSTFRAQRHLFCFDFEVGYQVYCNRHDTGFTLTDMVTSMTQEYDLGYYFNLFRRGRRDFGLRTSVLARYVLPIRRIFEDYHVWKNYSRYTTFGLSGTPGSVTPLGKTDYEVAMALGTQFFSKILNSLEKTSYTYDARKDQYAASTSIRSDLVVGIDYGKSIYGDYESTSDRLFYSRLSRASVQADKLDVIFGIMLRGISGIVDREDLKFFSLMDTVPAMKSLVEQYAIDDNLREVPTMKINGSSTNRLVVDPVYLNSDGQKLVEYKKVDDPIFSFTMQGLSLVFYANNYNSIFDDTMSDATDLRVLGVDSAGLENNPESIVFRNSAGNKTYVVPPYFGGNSLTYELAKTVAPISDLVWKMRDLYPGLAQLSDFNETERKNLEKQAGIEVPKLITLLAFTNREATNLQNSFSRGDVIGVMELLISKSVAYRDSLCPNAPLAKSGFEGLASDNCSAWEAQKKNILDKIRVYAHSYLLARHSSYTTALKYYEARLVRLHRLAEAILKNTERAAIGY